MVSGVNKAVNDICTKYAYILIFKPTSEFITVLLLAFKP